MKPSVHALFQGIIDYAGLFPPAELSMEEAFSRFREHRDSDDGWMLARFVCPASRLEELEPLLVGAEPPDHPIEIAVLGRGGGTLEAFLESIDQDAEILRAWSTRHAGRAEARVFEVRLPEAGGVAVGVENAWRRLTDGGTIELTPYFEVSLLGEWRPRLPAAAAAVRDTDRKAGDRNRVGLKIRCGGLEAAALPDVEAVAAAIAIARATGVALKATQGLHHPFRRHDPELRAMSHGFINLFAASVLALARDLPVTRLADVVAEVDPAAFVFDQDRIGWRDLFADTGEVADARRSLLGSFGSCSFSEPRNDLRALGLV